MPSDPTYRSISERLFCLLVHFFFGAMLSFSILLFCLNLGIYFGEPPLSLARAWLGYSILANICCVGTCACFAWWQRKRIPKRGEIIVIDCLAALVIVYGFHALINGRL